MADVCEAGGCLCRSVRYEVRAEPIRVTICHCTFCQRLTGSAFLVEPIFKRTDVTFTAAAPSVYQHRSDGSGKLVAVHFCPACGVHVMLSFERFPEVVGLFGGTFDDPNWFDRGPEKCRHIFTRSAQKGVVLPAGIEIYTDHALAPDGTPNKPVIFSQPVVVK